MDARQIFQIVFSTSIDDARNSDEQKRAIIEAEKQQALESLEMGGKLLSYQLSQGYIDELRELIEKRFAERLAMLDRGLAVWDYRISIVLIVSGTV